MKYATLFVTLSGLVSYLGYDLGQGWYLLFWISIDCFSLAFGYAGYGAKVFGKRPDGSIPVAVKAFYLPFMIYSACVWQLMRLLSREKPFDHVSRDIILARRLLKNEVPEGITNYVDLTAEMEDPIGIRKAASYINLPILDASVPSFQDLDATIARLKPGTTLVHCAQGHGRTGVFALALLAKRNGIRSFEEGMELLQSARPGVRLNRVQEAFIRAYINNISQ